MNKKNFITFLNNFELYIAASLFMTITILLTLQVLSRYLFGRCLTWTEEISIILFVWMNYFAICSATLKRKHIRMGFVLERMSFKTKKIALIFSNVMAILFFGYFLRPFTELVLILYNMQSTTPIIGFPTAIAYGALPIVFVLTMIRFIQDSINLAKEDEQSLGATKALLDLDSISKEVIEK